MNASDPPPTLTPSWVVIIGAAFGAITLIFLMILVILAVRGQEVPCNSRFLIGLVLSFGAALATAFLGGSAAAKGNIPLPYAKTHPVQFSATGGVAVLVIVMLFARFTYASDDCATKISACENEIDNLATTLTQKRLDDAPARYASVRSCVEALTGLEQRHKAAGGLISVVFTDVGGPPVPKRLRNIRAEVIGLVRKIEVTELSILLRNKPLDELDLVGADFRNTDLRNVSFKQSFLIEADFSGAILDGANFSEAYIRNVNFRNASLRNTTFQSADWFNAVNLEFEQLRQADIRSLLFCPKNVLGFHAVLKERYYYSFESWEKRIQDELINTWKIYNAGEGLCEKRALWHN